MADLVQIPWQKKLWLTPRTLARLQDASRRLGRNIVLNNNTDAAWRGYDQQMALFIANGRNPAKANDPDRGQRAHMRGGGLDVPTDAATQAAMKAAGFKRDANEPWHWNDPDIAFMPIIKTNTAAAGSSLSPLQLPKEEDTMLWKVSAPHRGIALMGPHLFRSLSPAQGNAEVNAADLLTDAEHRLSVSDAQFDTLRDILTRNDPRADGRAEFRTEPAKA